MLPKNSLLGTRVVERVSRPSTPLHARDEFGDGVQMKLDEVWWRPSRINPCNRQVAVRLACGASDCGSYLTIRSLNA